MLPSCARVRLPRDPNRQHVTVAQMSTMNAPLMPYMAVAPQLYPSPALLLPLLSAVQLLHERSHTLPTTLSFVHQPRAFQSLQFAE